MIRLIAVSLLGIICYFTFVQALECGITEQIESEDIQDVLRKCVAKKSGESIDKIVVASDSSESSEETPHQTYSARRGMTSRIRREALNGGDRFAYRSGNRQIAKRDVFASENARGNDDVPSEPSNNATLTSHKCVLECIFSDLGMLDANGYPEHRRVTEVLLKNAKGQELKDFFQDTADECFQLMEQGEKLSTCDYATHLVSCFSEKGKSNCADWQITNIPFHN